MQLDPRRIEVIDDEMVAVFRAKTGTERLRIVNGLYKSARKLVASGVRAQHPDWTEEQVGRETARRLLHGSR